MGETEYKIVPSKENGCCEKNEENIPKTYGYGVRHIQGFLYFLCLAIAYMARAHLGVTIVAMTMPPANTSINQTVNISNTTDVLSNLPSDTVMEDVTADDKWNIYKTYDWPKSVQEMVLGSFFLGYFIMMFPIGMVCQKWGGKIPLQLSMFVNAVISFLLPWIIAWGGWKALAVCRVMQGLSQAGMYPGITTLLSNWVPLKERGSLSSYVYTGSGFGTVVAFQVGGILAFSRFGWPSTFWVSGATCFIGFLLITIFGAATPDAHRSLSDEEKNYIVGGAEQRVTTKAKTPWKSILTSIPAWATFITHIGSAVCFVFFFTQVPSYMFFILKVNIRNSGLLSSLPYIAAFFALIFFGYFSDFCTNRKLLSVKNARIASNSISTFFPALCVACVSYTTNTVLAVTLFVLAVATHSAIHTGWVVNYIDLSPNYSGALMALGNTFANSFVLTLPVMVSYIVTDVTNQTQWRVMLLLMGALLTVTNALYIFFMSADVQPWNDTDEKNDIEIEAIKLETEKMKLKN